MCLWTFAHVSSGRGLVCVSWVSRTYVQFGHPVLCPCLYLLLYVCTSVSWRVSTLQRSCDMPLLFDTRKSHQQHVHLSLNGLRCLCVSPGLHI